MPDAYRSLAGPTLAEPPKVKGSRFIGEAFPVATEMEAAARIEEVRGREPSATHHCWAWRIGMEGHDFRTSDDGEPTGTAGIPILRQIEGRGLSDALVVVTRYYGGTKLGKGGLVRAYGEAAAMALDAGAVEVRVMRVPLRLRFAYGDTAAALQTLHRFDARVAQERYTEDTEMVLLVRSSQADALREALNEALGGRAAMGRSEGATELPPSAAGSPPRRGRPRGY